MVSLGFLPFDRRLHKERTYRKRLQFLSFLSEPLPRSSAFAHSASARGGYRCRVWPAGSQADTKRRLRRCSRRRRRTSINLRTAPAPSHCSLLFSVTPAQCCVCPERARKARPVFWKTPREDLLRDNEFSISAAAVVCNLLTPSVCMRAWVLHLALFYLMGVDVEVQKAGNNLRRDAPPQSWVHQRRLQSCFQRSSLCKHIWWAFIYLLLPRF